MADDSSNDLETILPARFRENLSEAERRLLRAAPKGEFAVCGPNDDDDDPGNDPATAKDWGSEREIRADLIRWLCVDLEASKRIDPRGVRAYGARVTGNIDLSFTTIAFPLLLAQCRINEDCNLQSANMPLLSLSGSLTQAVNAEGTQVKGNVLLKNGFSPHGEVRLLGGQIGGDLDCDGASFKNPGGKALNVDSAHIRGHAFLRDASAEGELKLLRAHVGGNLECDRGRFTNPNGRALNADSAEIAGNVFLRDRFSGQGEVNLSGAQIGGNLECIGGSFNNPRGRALNVNGAQIKGAVFLSKSFSSKGEVNVAASIGSNLECQGGLFRNSGAIALDADNAEIGGNVFLRDGFSSEGEVHLIRARIGGNLECDGGLFKNPNAKALNADSAEVKGNVFLRNGFSSDGEVALNGATIAGQLDCDQGRFINPRGPALNADGVDVRTYIFLRSASIQGEVVLIRARVGNNLECDRASFKSATGATLKADSADINGNVFLRDGFSAEKGIILNGARIGGQLDCHGGSFSVLSLYGGTVKQHFFWYGIKHVGELDLDSAIVGDISDDEASWPQKGHLHLDGFVYGSISGGPTDAPARLNWVRLQSEFTPQPYRQLATVLRELGDDQGAKDVLYELEKLARTETRRRLISAPRRWFHFSEDGLSQATVGYGVYPGRAIWYLVGLTALGWIVHRRAQRAGAIAPTDKDAYKDFHDSGGIAPAYYPPFNPLVYSLENCLPLVKFGQDDRWQPDPAAQRRVHLPLPRTGSRAWFRDFLFVRFPDWTSSPVTLRWFRWIMIALGWLLATFFVAGITGIIKTG